MWIFINKILKICHKKVYVPKPPTPRCKNIVKIDWKQRYFDASNAAIKGILSNTHFDELSSNNFDKYSIIGNAISYAKEFIAQIKIHNTYDGIFEQRYFDAALSALTGVLSNYKFNELSAEGFYRTNIVNISFEYADELIKHYKQTI